MERRISYPQQLAPGALLLSTPRAAHATFLEYSGKTIQFFISISPKTDQAWLNNVFICHILHLTCRDLPEWTFPCKHNSKRSPVLSAFAFSCSRAGQKTATSNSSSFFCPLAFQPRLGSAGPLNGLQKNKYRMVKLSEWASGSNQLFGGSQCGFFEFSTRRLLLALFWHS